MNLSLFDLNEVQEFLEAHKGEKPDYLAFKFRGKTSFPLTDVLLQLSLAEKASEKLPSWHERGCVFTRQALEQSTSETLAQLKSTLFKPEALVDLTAGLGVDAWAIGKSIAPGKMWLYEHDEDRASMLQWNFRKLGISSAIVINKSANQSEIKDWPENALVYIDPDRRTEGVRSLKVNDWSPDLTTWIPALLEQKSKILVKFSPMVDIHWIDQNFPGKKHFFVLGKEKEVKEVLVYFTPEEREEPATVSAIVLSNVNFFRIDGRLNESVSFESASPSNFLWIFDPHSAIAKAGLTAALAKQSSLRRLSRNTNYLLGNTLQTDFPGRQFLINAVLPFKPATFAQYVKEQAIPGAGIACKDFPETPEIIRKRFKLKEHSEHYLVFTREASGQLIVIHCKPC